MTRWPFVLFLAALLLLTGCAAGNRQPVSLAESLPPAPAPLNYTVDREWWQVYNDPHLDRLMSAALANNVDLAQAAISVNRALYQANLIGVDLLPSFSGSLTGSASRPVHTGAASTRSMGGSLSLRYELDLWRKLADSADAAEWRHQASVYDLDSARLSLINAVINAYFTLCYLEEALAVSAETLANYTRIEAIAKARYSAGKSDAVEPMQAAQSLVQVRNNLLDLQTRKKTAEQTLRNLLNAGPDAEHGATYRSLLEATLPPVDLDIPLAVLENRPDLRAAEARLQAAFKEFSVMGKSWLPSISLGSSLSSSSRSLGTAFDFPVAGGTVSISLPFLDWNRIRWNVKISEAAFDSVKLDFEKAVNTALNEVDACNFAAAQAAAAVRNADEKYAYDRQISVYYRQRWDAGAAELRDVLGALNTEASSRLALVSSRHAQIEAENRLYQALAGRYTRP